MCIPVALWLGCAHHDEVRIDPNELPPGEMSSGTERVPTAAPPEDRSSWATTLTRAHVEAVLRDGPGAFLARVDVAPAFSDGRFVGFRLVRARDLARWNHAGADLRPGDVVQRINGVSIERPEGVMAVFSALREARELRLDVLRDGRPVVVRQPILDAAPTAPR